MKKYTEIEGRTFEVITAPKEVHYIINSPYKAHNIYGAYKTSPSHEKVSTWEDWKKWADEIGLTMWVSSSNTWKYTIGFCGYWKDKKIWGHITDLHQRVVIV